ncbi:MAG TPA: Rpp14/Pop5 family protein [Methanoregula sp.]|nr:Rpp14/Pop5 family protein [Methanoregula sp.]
MTVRPPTLREKKRYILARIDPAGITVDAKDLYYAVYEAVVSLFGDVTAAAMQPSVLAIEKGYVLLRCIRGSEREFAIALSTLYGCRESTITLRVIAVSGTIESLRERIATLVPGQAPEITGQETAPGPEGSAGTGAIEYRFGTMPVEPVATSGHKIDVIEKGFKNTRRLFLTIEDLEKIHATTIPDGL